MTMRVLVLCCCAMLVVGCSATPIAPAALATSSATAPPTVPRLAPTPGALKHVQLQHVSPQVTDAPEVIAIENGFFRDEGFDVEITYMKGEVAAPALFSANLDYATDISSIEAAAIQGLPVVVVMVVRAGTDWSLVSQSDITRVPEDVRGKVVGTSGLGSGDYYVMSDWLSSKGLDPKNDVQFLVVGGTQERLAGLLSHQIDVGFLLPPANWTAQDKGLHELAPPGDLPKSYRGGLSVSRPKLQNEREEVRRFLRAMVRGLHYVHDPVHRDEVISVMARYTQQDPAAARRAFEFSYPILTKNGFVSDPADFERYLQQIAEQNKVAHPVTISDVADFSVLQDAVKDVGAMPE